MNTPDTPADGPHEIRDAIRRLLPHGSFDLAAVRGHGIPGVNANTRDGRDALVIRCRCMRRLEWPADEPLPMDVLLWWLIDHDDEMFLTPSEREAKYAAKLEPRPIAFDAFGLPLLPTARPERTQHGPQRHADAPAAGLATTETQPDAQEPQEAAEPLVHAELTIAVGPNRGQGTGYALCDNGDGTYPGGTLAHSSWQVNCEKCLAWPDEPGGEQ